MHWVTAVWLATVSNTNLQSWKTNSTLKCQNLQFGPFELAPKVPMDSMLNVYMNKPSVARYRNPNTGSCSQLVCAKPACTFYQCRWLIKSSFPYVEFMGGSGEKAPDRTQGLKRREWRCAQFLIGVWFRVHEPTLIRREGLCLLNPKQVVVPDERSLIVKRF